MLSCQTILAGVAIFLLSSALSAAETVLDSKLHHLRSGTVREWSDFPADAEGPALTIRFKAKANASEWALRLRQQDVKQTPRVSLNGKELGKLALDENDTVIFLPVPAGRLVDGENSLKIESCAKLSDDIRVGEIALDIDRSAKCSTKQRSRSTYSRTRRRLLSP